jgi:leucyl/phenylalanyl-tRNA--protein transferase
MPVYRIPANHVWFPNAENFDGDIVAVGGDMSVSHLLVAYSRGLFPWYNPGEEILWWCPLQRCVLYTDELKISHGLRNTLNRKTFTCTMDKAFEEVMEGCRQPRQGDPSTWISDSFLESYGQLFQQGYAHSVETWKDGELVGGLYGISLGRVFFGESMFARESDASKVALHHLVTTLRKLDFAMIDCQVYNRHLGTLGARVIDRTQFLSELETGLEKPIIRGSWSRLCP